VACCGARCAVGSAPWLTPADAIKELGAFLSEDVANRQLEFELSLWLSTLIDQERNVGAIQMTKDRFSEVSFNGH
jgi:hypothetical protein